VALTWITGAKGFIGRYLSRHLSVKGDTVFGVGHGAWPPEVAVKQGVSFWINGEIDGANLWQLLQHGGKPDVIYHLAGGSSVGFSMQSPQEDYHRTVTSTATLLEWVRCFSPDSKVVAVSSAAVYGDTKQVLLEEDGTYTPFSPYGYHKRLVELLAQSYVQNFGLRVAVVRLFSIYGPGLRKQLLWDICTKLAGKRDELALHGTGEELRDWLHVDDAVRIVEVAGYHSAEGFAIFNGGTGIGTSVGDVVQLLGDAWGNAPKIVFSGKQRPGDPVSLVADTTRLKRDLNIVAQQRLHDGIQSYVNWFKAEQA
jgi:UDP-glucose 4-epimerase